MGNITPTDLLDKKSPKLTSEDIEKNASQSGQILSLLVAAGARGCTNEQLWGICHAVNSRMGDLREQGYTIRSKRERGRIWKYWLEPAPAETKPPTFEERHRREEAERFPLFAAVAS